MTAPRMELRRSREDTPTESGWYYGQASDITGIKPINVEERGSTSALGVWQPATDSWRKLDGYIWFGPVPTCVESGT